jgi:hypothetical protein
MKPLEIVLNCTLLTALLFCFGCTNNYSGYSHSRTYAPLYSGISRHWKTTQGTSNLTLGYKDPPFLDSNDPVDRYSFEKVAENYLKSLVNDLEEVKENTDIASEKARDVVDAANSGLDFFYLPPVRKKLRIDKNTNFGFWGYPEFPDFDYYPPQKPTKPLFLDDEFGIQLYNNKVDQYNRELADFLATIEDYEEDAEHYCQNCRNDYEEIRQKGLDLLNRLESLDVSVDIDLQ